MANPTPPSANTKAELRLTGLGVAPGIAIGTVFLLASIHPGTATRRLMPHELRAELDRFHNAMMLAHAELDASMRNTVGLPANAAEEINRLLEAHKAMLEGTRLIRGVEARIEKNLINAEAALEAEVDALCHSFAVMEDSYMAARGADVRAVGAMLLSFLLQNPARTLAEAPKGSVILGDDLTPSDTAALNPKRIAGLATLAGGAEGHTAIMARSLRLPAVTGISTLLDQVNDGDTVILDGREGLVILHPTADTLRYYQQLRTRIHKQRAELAQLARQSARTTGGIKVKLLANLELPSEVESAVAAGADGIGLLRSEFMFMNRKTLPSENEQYAALKKVVEGMKGKPVTIRTLDIGGEKIAPALSRHYEKSPNPALGLRAIRLSLAEPELLLTQFKACLRASKHGPIRILLPMVNDVAEVQAARALLKQAATALKLKGKLPPLGVMIETPAAALCAAELAKVSAFFALGTNDLTQYTLAVDRADEKVAHLFHTMHPAVLQLIKLTVKAAEKAGIPVCVCGEMAGDARQTAQLLKLGLRELSMTPSALLTVKKAIRAL